MAAAKSEREKKIPSNCTVCVYPLVFYYYCTCTVRVRVQCTAGDNLLDPQKSSPFENIQLLYTVRCTRVHVVNFYLRRYFRTFVLSRVVVGPTTTFVQYSIRRNLFLLSYLRIKR